MLLTPQWEAIIFKGGVTVTMSKWESLSGMCIKLVWSIFSYMYNIALFLLVWEDSLAIVQFTLCYFLFCFYFHAKPHPAAFPKL